MSHDKTLIHDTCYKKDQITFSSRVKKHLYLHKRAMMALNCSPESFDQINPISIPGR